MRAVLQRVTGAEVTSRGETVSIGKGLLILLGVGKNDDLKSCEKLARKTAALRIFEDDAGKMNLSCLDTGGQALVVSQFTLYADTRKGNRPSFTDAGDSARAEELYLAFEKMLSETGIRTAHGFFGEDMKVTLTNDGPVTISLDTDFL